MKVYVAGPSSEPHRCQLAMDNIRELGHTITCDWLKAIDESKAQGFFSDIDLPLKLKQKYANEDLHGVARADLVWCLIPNFASVGVWVELGYALAYAELNVGSDMPLVVIVSGGDRRPLFTSLASRDFVSDKDAFNHIKATYHVV